MVNPLNITQFTSYEQIVLAAHSFSAVPALLILYIVSALIVLLVGLLLIDHTRSGYGKFILIWIIAEILIGIVLTWFILSPNTIQTIKNFFNPNSLF